LGNLRPAKLASLLAAAVFAGLQAQITPPAAPEIIRVSVDTLTGLADIRWNPSPSSDVEKYTVYYYKPGIDGALAVDTVSGDTREYVYTTLDPSAASQTLTVAAVDSSGTGGILPEPPHSTMHLAIMYDSCEKAMELEWTAYVGWDDLVKYEVYFSVDGGAYTILKKDGTQGTSELHLGIVDNRRYCYFIKAVSARTHSFSNIVCRNVSHPLYPAWINAESASAIGTDVIEVKFAVDPAGEVSSFRLYKAAGPGKPFIRDAILSRTGDSIVHQDPVISTKLRWLYKLYALDVCNNINPETESNVCGNIVLNARSVALEAFLSWSPYSDYEAGVNAYRVYRDIKRAGPVLIAGTSPPDTSFQDDLSFLSGEDIQDEICYYLVAEENDNYTRGKQGFSRSNEACVSVVPEIRMANALIPNATNLDNSRIQPILTFIPQHYVFQVFDRWGSKIFETSDPAAFWYGNVNGGKKVPEGVYVYYIRLTTSSGIEVEKKGEITVFYK